MTKCIVIGEERKKDLTPIEIELVLNSALEFETSDDIYSLSDFKYVELICKDYDGVSDLIFFYNNKNERNKGILAIGQWNDGIV